MPNFFTERTVIWKDSEVVLIDQRKLPTQFSYLRCRRYQEVVEAIRTLAVRGAPAIGVASAMGVSLQAARSKARDRESLLEELKAAAVALVAARPTAVNPSWAVKRVLEKALSAKGSVKEIKEAVLKEAQQLAEEDVKANHSIGKHGSSLINDGDVVLTHCKWPPV